MRHFRKPLAGLVICGSGPNLSIVLNAHYPSLVFLIQIFLIILPIRVVAFSHPHYPTSGMFCGTLIMHAPELDSLHLLSVRPKSSAPSCWPMRSPRASAAFARPCAPATNPPELICGPASSDATSTRQLEENRKTECRDRVCTY